MHFTRPAFSRQQPPGAEGRILLVDNEPLVRRELHSHLHTLGFDVAEASDEQEAIAICRIIRFEVVLFGIEGQGGLSLDICNELRRILPHVVILLLSANNDRESKVEALEAVADDYLAKPVDLRELTARIRAALRRARGSVSQRDEVIVIGDICLDVGKRLVLKAGQPVHLTPKEFDLLCHLMMQPGRPATHARLLQVVWGSKYATHVEYLRTFIRQLRKKIEDDANQPRYLLTNTHIGYRFADPMPQRGNMRGRLPVPSADEESESPATDNRSPR
jgi:two-component system KDP operon response regulator KdpE